VVDGPTLLSERYRLAECIGSGGMGRVWRARDERLGRDVAVKEVVFPPRISAEPQHEAIERIQREARAAARLNHPGVITVHDVIDHDARPWIVMELVCGGSLADLIAARGPLPVQEAARIGLQVLGALSAAHAAGVVHRDVKPSNVLIDGDRVVLTDFGAAVVQGDPRFTATGTVIGTVAYLAPECAKGRDARAESDLWSLGATLYEAVEGRPPFDADNPLTVLHMLATSEPPPPVRAGLLAPILRGLLRTDPAGRLSAERAATMLASVTGASPPSRQPAASGNGQPVRKALTHPATLPADPRQGHEPPGGHIGNGTAPDTITVDVRAKQVLHPPASPGHRQPAVIAAESAPAPVPESRPAPVAGPGEDPWEASKNSSLPDGSSVVRVLGAGSTTRTLLVARNDYQVVVKVARSAEVADRIENEARVLSRLRHSGIVRLRREPYQLGGRTVIEIDVAGQKTLRTRLQAGRCPADEIERLGAELLDVLQYLEQADIRHHRIRPDSLALRLGADGASHLVLFDFSLAGAPSEKARAGGRSSGYSDPFGDTASGLHYAADRYAVAATLHEMTSGTAPAWDTTARPADGPRLSARRFPARHRNQLTAFFEQALAREATSRFGTADDMRRAWAQAFQKPEPLLQRIRRQTSTRHLTG
jgi:serine/threonine protein kinase